jgi:hypothetical protein
VQEARGDEITIYIAFLMEFFKEEITHEKINAWEENIITK